MSRGPITDPNHVPFTYVTEAVSFTVRDGALVELAFTGEHVVDPEADEPPARVVAARLAMPMATAAGVADVLGRITDRRPDAPHAPEPPVEPDAVAQGVVAAGLDFVVRELLDHSVADEDRGELLDWLRERLHREFRRTNLAGDEAGEDPAVARATDMLDALFARWRLPSDRDAP